MEVGGGGGGELTLVNEAIFIIFFPVLIFGKPFMWCDFVSQLLLVAAAVL